MGEGLAAHVVSNVYVNGEGNTVNLTNVVDIATLGQSSSSRISPTDMEQLNEAYLVTSTPHTIELVYDPIEILTIVNDVDISFFKNKIRFRPKKLGVYRFCYQEVID